MQALSCGVLLQLLLVDVACGNVDVLRKGGEKEK